MADLQAIAFWGSVTGPATTATLQVAPVADTKYPISGNTFVMTRPVKVLGGYVASTGLTAAKLDAPSLSRVAPSYVRPVQSGAADGKPPDDPNMMVLFDHPLSLVEGDTLALFVATATAGAENVVGVLFVTDGLDEAPDAPSFRVKFTATGTAVVGKWTPLTLSWVVSPPPGAYAVLGIELQSSNCIASRLAVPGRLERPGMLGVTALGNRTHEAFYEGRFGVLGVFKTTAPPVIEVLASAADASFEGYLRIAPIGDLRMALPGC